jgi:aldehyde dehydrogenase (NAD+)
MLVPNARMAEAVKIAKAAAEATAVGATGGPGAIGPVVSSTQWDKIQTLIAKGIEEGATVVAGGLGRPHGLTKGYYVRPTVLAGVDNQMTVAREEIFGPVLTIIGYDTVDEAVDIANDTPYGLAAYVSGSNQEQLRQVASRLRAGQVSSPATAANGGNMPSASFSKPRPSSATAPHERWRQPWTPFLPVSSARRARGDMPKYPLTACENALGSE